MAIGRDLRVLYTHGPTMDRCNNDDQQSADVSWRQEQSVVRETRRKSRASACDTDDSGRPDVAVLAEIQAGSACDGELEDDSATSSPLVLAIHVYKVGYDPFVTPHQSQS